jgi:hypothetical protein
MTFPAALGELPMSGSMAYSLEVGTRMRASLGLRRGPRVGVLIHHPRAAVSRKACSEWIVGGPSRIRTCGQRIMSPLL